MSGAGVDNSATAFRKSHTGRKPWPYGRLPPPCRSFAAACPRCTFCDFSARGRRGGQWFGARIRAEHLQRLARRAYVSQRRRHRLIAFVAVDVDEEHVLPRAAARRAALDLAHVQAALARTRPARGTGCRARRASPAAATSCRGRSASPARARRPGSASCCAAGPRCCGAAPPGRRAAPRSRRATAAPRASSCACRAPSAVERASTTDARGRCAASQRRHCPAATGIEYTRSTSFSATPARASRHMWISSAISALILRSLSRNVSKVWMMPPSVVFSTGTTPKSAPPRCDLLEHARDRPDRRRARRQPELLLDGHVRKRPFGAEVGDAHALLQRQAGAEDLLEHGADRVGRERPRVGRRQPIGDLAFARRHVERHRERVSSARRPCRPGRRAGSAAARIWSSARSISAAQLVELVGSWDRPWPSPGQLTTLRRMRLATLRDGTRDGALVVVGRDGDRCARAAAIAPTLQAALDDWDARRARAGRAGRHGWTRAARRRRAAGRRAAGAAAAARLRVDRRVGVPDARRPRAQGARRRAARHAGDAIRSSTRAARACCSARATTSRCVDPGWGLDFESEIAVILGDTPQGTTAADAPAHVRLLMLANDVTLRNLVPDELAKGLRLLPVEAGDRVLAVRDHARRAGRRVARRPRPPAAAHVLQRRAGRRSRRGRDALLVLRSDRAHRTHAGVHGGHHPGQRHGVERRSRARRVVPGRAARDRD